MSDRINIIQPDTDCLFIIHLQNDLIMPIGNIPVPDGDQIIEPIKKILLFFEKITLCLLKMPLYHPAFKPVKFCVYGSWGAEYPYFGNEFRDIRVLRMEHGYNINFPINSHFSDPGFLETIRNWGIKRIFLSGLPLETDVKELALILKEQGFEVIIFEDCVKPRDKALGEIAKQDLEMAGIQFMNTSQFFE